MRFPEVLETAIAELAPHRLTEYLYELSEVFNSFYRDCKVGHSHKLVCSPAGGVYALFAALSQSVWAAARMKCCSVCW